MYTFFSCLVLFIYNLKSFHLNLLGKKYNEIKFTYLFNTIELKIKFQLLKGLNSFRGI